MNAKLKEPSWLKGVLNRGEQTQSYHFQSGDRNERAAPAKLTLDQRANNCRKAFNVCDLARADLASAEDQEREVNAIARNHVVECQGALMKAEIALQEAQKEYTDAAAAIPGVPA